MLRRESEGAVNDRQPKYLAFVGPSGSGKSTVMLRTSFQFLKKEKRERELSRSER